MTDVAKSQPVSFVLGLGDSFYDTGIKSVDDTRFQTTFEDIYSSPELQKRWYMVPGNHDYKGNVSAEVMYTQVLVAASLC
jgi:tartrate-resistant acid phosphatase type 5